MTHRLRIGACTLGLGAAALLLNGCQNDILDREAALFSVELQVLYPDHYSVDMANGITVRLINIDNGLVDAKTSNGQGLVVFERVPRGQFRLSAGVKLAAADAILLGETIVDEDDVISGRRVNLNGTLENITVDTDKNLGSIRLKSSLPGDYLIKEVFYTGTRSPNSKPYYSDHFVEIYNNTDKPLFADSICVATVYGANGSSVTSSPTLFADDTGHVYLDFVWMVPGTGHSVLMPPGKSILVAQDGFNHRSDANGNPGSIDLSVADFETFLVRPNDQRDVDFAVPNMTEVFASRPNTHDWILHSYGASVVIFKTSNLSALERVPEPSSSGGYELIKLPVSAVLDAFEALANSTSGKFKRVPASLDMGFAFCRGIFNGESCRRKKEDTLDGRVVLQDTNNSSEDFEILVRPTPKSFE